MIKFKSNPSQIKVVPVSQEEVSRSSAWLNEEDRAKYKHLYKHVADKLQYQVEKDYVTFSVKWKSKKVSGTTDLTPRNGIIVSILGNSHFIHSSEGRDNFHELLVSYLIGSNKDGN
jgi:hypothetical protein